MMFYKSTTKKRQTHTTNRNEPLDRRTISECLLKIGGLIILLICVMGAAMIYFGLDRGDGVHDAVTIGGIVLICIIPFIAAALIWFSCRHFCSTHVDSYHAKSHDGHHKHRPVSAASTTPWPQQSSSVIDVTADSVCATPATTEENLSHRDSPAATRKSDNHHRSYSNSDDSASSHDENEHNDEPTERVHETTKQTINSTRFLYPTPSAEAPTPPLQGAAAASLQPPARESAHLHLPPLGNVNQNGSLFERKNPPQLHLDFRSVDSAQPEVAPKNPPTLPEDYFSQKY